MISRQHSQGNTSWAGMRVIQKDTSHKPAAYTEAFPKCVSLSSSDSLSHTARWPRLLTGHTRNGLGYGRPAICAGCNFKESKSFCHLVQVQCMAPFPSQFPGLSPPAAALLHGTQTTGLPFPSEGSHPIFKDLSLLVFFSSRLTNHESLGI